MKLCQKIEIGLGCLLFGMGVWGIFAGGRPPQIQPPPVIVQFSPHYEERVQPISQIVIHSFALSVPEMIDRLDTLKVSTHYLIDTQGKIIRLVPDDKVAWHAGKSYWRGQTGLNATSIGVELQNDTLGQTPFTQNQISSCIRLLQYLIQKYQIKPTHIVSHSDISPARKVDVGKAFPWQQIAKLGIGIWGENHLENLSLITDEAQLLSDIGYDVSDLDKALLAFERHYMPELVSEDLDIPHLEENLTTVQPIRNEQVLRRLNAVRQSFQIK